MSRRVALRIAAWLALCGASVPAQEPATGGGSEGASRAAVVALVQQAWHVTDVHREALWPGFDLRAIPILVAREDREELLFGDTEPPDGFVALDDHRVDAGQVLARPGVSFSLSTMLVDLGGEKTVLISWPPGEDPLREDSLTLLFHESFHVFQLSKWEFRGVSVQTDYDPERSARLGVESAVLHAALDAAEEDAVRLARTYVAARRDRYREMSAEEIRAEAERELGEGTATYVQHRLHQLLGSERLIQYERSKLAVPNGGVFRVMDTLYWTGMAMGVLLDRHRPGWKRELHAANDDHEGSLLTVWEIFERQFPVREDDAGPLVAAARQRFGHEELLARQSARIQARAALMRELLSGPGRRHKIDFRQLQGATPPRDRTRSPVYVLPSSLARDDPSATGYVGLVHERGIARIAMSASGEKVARFESREVPVLQRGQVLEWLDAQPQADGGDVVIEWERREADVVHGLHVATDGYTLWAGRAHVELADDLVTIELLGLVR